jgi:hypothetical protein
MAAMLLVLSGCSGGSETRSAPPGRCVDVAATVGEQIMQQHAVASLPSEVRDELAASLNSGGRVCLTAPTETTSCNSGGARAPEIGKCCRFAQPPQGDLSGLPQRIRIRGDAGPETRPTIELELRTVLMDLALDQRCGVPTCASDRATARPQIAVKGHVRSATGNTEFEVKVDLDALLDLTCSSTHSGLSRDPASGLLTQ